MKKNLQDYLGAVKVFSAIKEEPTWMLELREKALEKIEALPFPTIERVKYERWPLFNISEAALNGETAEIDAVPAFDEMNNNPMVVQQDDVTIFEQLPISLSMQGVIFTDLFTAMLNHPELVQENI